MYVYVKNLKNIFLTFVVIATSTFSCDAQENTPKISTPSRIDYSYEIIVDSLDIPWGMSFIDENDLLVTEKNGILYRIKDGIKKKIRGLPPVYLRGQGGLLDIAVSPNYKKTREIYFTMSSEVDAFNDIFLSNKSISDEDLMKNLLIKRGVEIIRKEYPYIFSETLNDFIETFKDELIKGYDPIEKFQLFLDVNYYPDIKDENDLKEISELNSQIKKIELSNDKNLYKEEKKLKNKLRSIQKKYSFLPQSGRRESKRRTHCIVYIYFRRFGIEEYKDDLQRRF